MHLMRRAILLATLTAAAALPARADTVRMTVSYYSANTGPYFEKMAADFHAANPSIEVKIEVVNWANLLQKLQTDISGGANPDLSIIGTRWLPDFVKDGIAEPLDQYITPEMHARFIQPFLKPGQLNGKTYGLPIAASSRAMYYNKDMLAKAGFPDGPATWDDVAAAAEKIKADGNFAFGIQARGIEVDVYYYYALWAYGGDVVGPDNKAAFASPAGVQALTLYKSLIDRGLTEPGVTGYNAQDIQALFKQGRLGMVMTSPILIGQITREAPNLNYGIAPIPKGTVSSTYAVTDSVVMFANSKVKPSAWKFLDFLFTPGPRVAFTKGESFLPTTIEEAKDPYFTTNDKLKVFVGLLPSAHFAPTVTGWEDTAKAVTDALQAAYLGNLSPEAALRQAADKANQSLGK
jgi:multiple sugar transport system substrate-binding protein